MVLYLILCLISIFFIAPIPGSGKDDNWDALKPISVGYEIQLPPVTRAVINPDKTTKFIEVIVAFDESMVPFFERYSKITDKNIFVKEINKYMNHLYKKVGFHVFFKKVITFTEKNPMLTPLSLSLDETLDRIAWNVNLNLWKKNRHDALLVFSWYQWHFRSSTRKSGMALLKTVCRDYIRSVAIVRILNKEPEKINREDIIYLAKVASHELGHVLGLTDDHYDDHRYTEYGMCKSPKNVISVDCVMSWQPTRILGWWAQNSITALSDIEREGQYFCLMNTPNHSPDSVVSCGNGVIEPGEECDCPIRSRWCTQCCNTDTCKLRSGAECAGECCDHCRKPRHHVRKCRTQREDNTCDEEDICDSLGECFDRRKIDGLSCSNPTFVGKCISGMCMSPCPLNCNNNGICMKTAKGKYECECSDNVNATGPLCLGVGACIHKGCQDDTYPHCADEEPRIPPSSGENIVNEFYEALNKYHSQQGRIDALPNLTSKCRPPHEMKKYGKTTQAPNLKTVEEVQDQDLIAWVLLGLLIILLLLTIVVFGFLYHRKSTLVTSEFDPFRMTIM